MRSNHESRFEASCLAIFALLASHICSTAISAPANAQTQTTVAITYFDEPLAPYGYWIDDPDYGRVWRPRQTSADWRPYTEGRWVYTIDYGWIWVSEEPWGWVVYHYGRWVWSNRYGWVWVAGDDWGPAWVEWCYGAGYVGWAPMPPDPYWQGAYYYGSYDCASPGYYSRAVFMSETYFASPRVSAHVVASSQNAVVARGTVNVTSYSRVGSGIMNRSIDIAKLQAATGQAIKPVRVVQSNSPVATSAVPRPLRELTIYRPSLAGAKPPRLDMAIPPQLKLEPEQKGLVLPPRGPLETGGIGTPPLDRPTDSLTPPSLGGIGPPNLGSGPLGGLRGKLGR
jgi:hypothetical protein